MVTGASLKTRKMLSRHPSNPSHDDVKARQGAPSHCFLLICFPRALQVSLPLSSSLSPCQRRSASSSESENGSSSPCPFLFCFLFSLSSKRKKKKKKINVFF